MLPAKQRWCLYRRLYEEHAVTPKTLSDITRIGESTLLAKIKRDNWLAMPCFIDGRGALKQLVEAFLVQLEQLKKLSLENPFDEKSTRLLASLAKTLDVLLELMRKMSVVTKKELSPLGEHPTDAMAFDAQIEKLAEGLAQSGKNR